MSGNFVESFIIVLNFTNQQRYITTEPVHPGHIALCVVFLVMLETLGNFLLFCMILYEKYGMDPQKRTVTNQLLSHMIILQIFNNIFVMPVATTALIFQIHSK